MNQKLKTLSWAAGPKIIWIFVLLILGFLGRALTLGTGNLLALWVDLLINQPDISHSHLSKTVGSLPLGMHPLHLMIYFLTFGFIFTWIFRIGFSDLCALFVSKIHDELVLRVSRYPQEFFDKNPVGRIVTRFASDYGNVFRLFGGPLAEFISIIFDLILIVALLAMTNYRFLPFLLASVLIHWLIYTKWRPYLHHNRQELSRNRAPGVSHFAETLQGTVTIRIFEKERSFLERFKELDNLFLNQKFKTVKSVSLFTVTLNVLAFTLYLSLALYSWFGITSGKVTLGDVGLAFGLVALSGNMVQMFFEWLAQFEEAIVGLDRLNEYLALPLEPGALLPPAAEFPTPEHTKNRIDSLPSDGQKNRFFEPKIRFHHVWFRYHDRQPWVLKDINIEIPCIKLGIIGVTGSGKSSLVQCLFQLYPIQKGEIHIGPYQLPHLHCHANQTLDQIRSSFAYIPQDPLILKGTLRDNIDPLNLYSDDQIRQVLSRLSYNDWENRLHDTIQEKGRNLSAGEKQLIQMVRVILSNRPIVILDEATSHVDPSTEKIMMKIIEQELNHKLLLIIAHRLETLHLCHKLLWIHHGEVRGCDQPGLIIPEFLHARKNFARP